MAQVYRELSYCNPSARTEAYIYAIQPVAYGQIAAITSSDELLLLQTSHLQTTQPIRFQRVPAGLTSLITTDDGNILVCAGTTGAVSSFDVRSRERVANFDIGRGVTALASCKYDIAVGTELAHQQAIVSVWDRRQNTMRWQNAENNDDITALDFHPLNKEMLMSGGDDGLVSIFDTNINEEDDNLIQAVNHGPIHKAGFLNNTTIYALSSDQNLAFYPVWDDRGVKDRNPVLVGDLRPIIPCEYVIDVLNIGDDRVVAAGSHSESRVNLVKISSELQIQSSQPVLLVGAHGTEIVRSIFADNKGCIFTAGEDGKIKSFGPAEPATNPKVMPKGSESKRGSKERYKPY